MAANTNPIYTAKPDVQWITGVTAANTTTDLTTGTSYLAFTAGATDGGYVQRLRIRPLGANLATVARVWINNGSDPTASETNNILFDEISIAASTASNVAALSNYEIPLNFALPAGYKLYITLGTAVSGGFAISVIGGKYS